MTASALRIADRPVRTALAARPGRPAGKKVALVHLPLARMLATTAAFLALLEILVDRAGAVLIAFLAPSQPALARGLELGGSGVVGAVATLVILSALVFAAASREVGRYEWGVLPITAVLVVIASSTAGSGAMALHGFVILGAAVLAAAPGPRGFMRAAVVSAGFSIALGQMAFLVPAVGDWTLVRSLVEAGLLAAPVLAAISLVEGGTSRAVRIAGVVAAVSAAGLMWTRPSFSALLSAWVLGAMLSLPLIFYVAAAGAAGMLAAGAIIDRRVRLIAAGILLLWVAGTAPTAVHHNLSALLGLLLMTQASISETSADEEGALCRT